MSTAFDLFAGCGGMGTFMKNAFTVKGAELMSVEDFHRDVVEGRYREEIDAIREAYAEGKMVESRDRSGNVETDCDGNVKMVPLYELLKKRLPYFVCQADVRERRIFESATDFTGYAPIDIDHLTTEQLPMVMERMKGLSWVKEGHVSSRGEGGHFIVAMGRIPIDDTLSLKERKAAYDREYKRRYAEITEFVQRELGVPVDAQCKDVLRGFYMSADADAFIRPDEEMTVFVGQATSQQAEEAVSQQAEETAGQQAEETASQQAEETMGKEVTSDSFNPQLIKAYIPMHQYKPSMRHSWWIGFAQYLKWKGVKVEQLGLYHDMMKAHLMMCGHIRQDDPCVRSANEVKDAMKWGFEHSETKPATDTAAGIENGQAVMPDGCDDSEFRATLKALRLPIGIKQTIHGVPDVTILPIICGIMPLCMAYATNVSVRYCDGKVMRLNGMSMIIGGQGGKKSSVKYKLDIWRQPLRESDSKARKLFDDFKQKRRNRRANDPLPPEPTDTIIEVPITISCSTLLKRMKNAHGRHLFSFGEELDTLRKSNGAGSWSSKYDVYRLSFDNGEWGQDYNSDQAESGVVETAYNWTILGTEGAFAKCFTADNVENGLGGRVFPARMPSSQYEYMPSYKDEPLVDVECITKAVDILRSSSGLYELPKLCRRMTLWCNRKADEARQHGDSVLDTFRKRAAVIGFRCGVVFHLLEQRDSESSGCMDFAELMAEYCLKNQCEMFGEILTTRKVRNTDGCGYRSRNKSLFEELPDEFDWDMILGLRPDTKPNALRVMIHQWKASGLIGVVDKNKWRKTASK